MKRLFIRLLHLFLSCAFRAFHLSVKLYHTFTCAFPFSFGKTNYLFKIICPLLFVSTQIFLLFDCQRSCEPLRTLVGLDGLEPSTSRLSGARSSHLSYKPELTHGLYDSFIFCLSPSPFLPARSLTVGLQDGVPGFGSRHCRLVEMKGIEPLTPCLQGRCSPS